MSKIPPSRSHLPSPPECRHAVALAGVPWDEYSSYLRGPSEAPEAIRQALHCEAGNSWTEAGLDLSASSWRDAGDFPIVDAGEGGDPMAQIREGVLGLLEAGDRPLLLGGDHAVTYPILQAMAAHHADLTILHFDAHPDLYPIFEDNPFSNACPFARALEDGLCQRLVQVGIRTMEGRQRKTAEKYGVEIVTMGDLAKAPPELDLRGPVYLSFDLDVLDPAFAPGLSHREPGGMSTRQALDLLHLYLGTSQGSTGATGPVLVGADLVELNPSRDVDGLAASAAGKLTQELLGLLLTSDGQSSP